MSCAVAAVLCVPRGNTPTLMARIEAKDDNHDSTPVVQADVETITYTVRDITDDGNETVSGTLNEADVIFDTLQTGDVWDADSTGFNFLHTLPTGAIDTNDHEYVAEYTLMLTSAAGGAVVTWRYPIIASQVWGVEAP